MIKVLKIIPITDLRNTSVNNSIFVTKNGYGDLVIMSMETYEEELSFAEIYKSIFKSEKEIEEEKNIEGEEVVKKTLKLKYTQKT
jgi:electron transfer flavoprotein alpha subunit